MLTDAHEASMYDLPGGRHDHVGPNKNGWRMQTARWPYFAKGWYPQISAVKPDPDSIMPYFGGDIMHNKPGVANVTVPPITNHANPDGTIKGANLLFLDGHVQWQPIEPGISWKGGVSGYTDHWWNPTGQKPINFTLHPASYYVAL